MEMENESIGNDNLMYLLRTRVDKHLNDDWKTLATDDAYPSRYYRWPTVRLADAIRNHKEFHDPTMLDAMNSPLELSVEMNMIGDKPTRLVSNFQKLVAIKHPFEHGQERSILVFAKEEVTLRSIEYFD